MNRLSYTIKELSKLTGLTPRTLRYYESLNLLKPKRNQLSNYRIYNDQDVKLIQQIMIFKEMDFELKQIERILKSPAFDLLTELEKQAEFLKAKLVHLNAVINNVEQTITEQKGLTKMTDQERFKALKQRQIDQNEAIYGSEIRDQYGDKLIDASNQHYQSLDQKEMTQLTKIEHQLIGDLKTILREPDKKETLASQIFKLHQAWIQIIMPNYSLQIHRGIAQIYLSDKRFQAYYDQKAGSGATKMLVGIIIRYTH